MDYRNIDHHEDEDLLLEELVPHGEEGNGQPTAEEEDEVQSQLVPESIHELFSTNPKPQYLLLMEKGKLSPGGGRPCPLFLAREVENPLAERAERLASWANIFWRISESLIL